MSHLSEGLRFFSVSQNPICHALLFIHVLLHSAGLCGIFWADFLVSVKLKICAAPYD
uniref:Uncharacterized protein n=1 Tax=Rhizophagus irregularis (strain DAOM 181602 / DAOM 197198 / MUCL 43194) TaxID=747089 RepID=U9SYZ2_RHIID